MRSHFHNILVSTDLSEVGNSALRHAYRLVDGREARMIVVHSLDIHPTPSPLYAHYVPGPLVSAEQRDELETKLTQMIQDSLPNDAEYSKVEQEIVIVEHSGPAYEAILETAQERGAEIIVMSSHGLTNAMHMLVGSTTEQVIRHSKIPVLVIPHP